MSDEIIQNRRDDRWPSTHVSSDGSPKVVFATEAEAAAYALEVGVRVGRQMEPYACWMKPLHWHVGNAVVSRPRAPR